MRLFVMTRKQFFKVANIAILPLAAVAGLEGVLFLLGYGTTYEREDPFLGFQSTSTLFEKRVLAEATCETLYVTRKSKLQWFNAQQFCLPKPSNVYRIFCFGGSTTYGRPYFFKTSFSNWLEVLLQSVDPLTDYEVINVGGVSYASYRIVNLMNEIIEYQPDLFIVYSGHNEFLEHRTYSHILAESPIITNARIQLNQLRSYSLARNAWLTLRGREMDEARRSFQMTGDVNTLLDQSHGLDLYHRNLQQEKAILDHFRFNLGRMIDISNGHDVGIVFVVPPSNEKDFSPFKSELSSHLTPQETSEWQNLYQAGMSFLSQKKPQLCHLWCY